MAVYGCRGTLEERFWRKVNKTETCWIWIGALNNEGYGTFGTERISKGRMRVEPAHRVAWKLLAGPIPDGMVLDHDNQQFGCGNSACVNPDHLQLVTRGVNKQRGRKVPCHWPTHHRNTNNQPLRVSDPQRKLVPHRGRVMAVMKFHKMRSFSKSQRHHGKVGAKILAHPRR